MKFSLSRELLLKPLQQVAGAISGRPSLPILGNILLKVEGGELTLTCTDHEVELIARIAVDADAVEGAITVPSRKFLDICRGLPSEASISFSVEGDRVLIRSGRSRFTLSTLPADDFPNIEDWQSDIDLTLTQGALRQLIERTHFSMANQDVRYYLNGMQLQTEGETLRSVATDGHRLAIAEVRLDTAVDIKQVIVPRKGITELMRLLDEPDEVVVLQVGESNIRAELSQYVFTSKLVDGRFPDYRRVLPQGAEQVMLADCEILRQALSRAAILSNERFRSVTMNVSNGLLRISANNPEQEEAEELVDVDYQGEEIEIGFNIGYVLDVLNTLKCQNVRFSMKESASAALIEDCDNEDAMYVVMPHRL
ncbi:DNA polymerase III subunit beta [Veronia nyctiphanis]|uniref:Beta sliding clamp n=1 Tax=Veronia nyctiphanis TaxID=1278244 RepID=A0A4Q0YT71_9GAMM|nr:DNA polymerase III subunit beta [Veronia nyctiphanis]RXJ72191.1 DNA polymerase III subunit beta [Veronia nyctiphanis]